MAATGDEAAEADSSQDIVDAEKSLEESHLSTIIHIYGLEPDHSDDDGDFVTTIDSATAKQVHSY